MKPFFASTIAAIAFLSVLPTVLATVTISSSAEAAEQTRVFVSYEAGLQPATQGGAINQQFKQPTRSDPMMPAMASDPAQVRMMPTPTETVNQSRPSTNNSYPGCQGVEQSKEVTDTFSYIEALHTCKFGS